MAPEKLHRAQPRCPVCGSEDRTKPVLGLARDKEPEYVRALARGLRVTVEALGDPLVDYSCSNCGTVYVDPTLSDESVSRLFLNHAPIHNWGWDRFTKKLLSDPPESGEVEALEAFIRAEFGLPDSYLEVGCPFGGFAVMWADGARVRRAVTSLADQNFYPRKGYRRLLKVNVGLMQFSMRLAARITRLWLALARAKRRTSLPSRDDAKAIKLAFLGQFSMNRWSYGCKAFGLTCTEMASRGIGANVLSLERLTEMSDDSYSLAGIINSLDHSDNPLELLTEVTRVSKRVLVAGHRLADAHIQHRFAFSDDTLPRLASELGLLCQDISSVLRSRSDNWFAFLLVKS